MREVAIINIEEFAGMGILATIEFLDAKIPTVGEDIICDNIIYRIAGVVFSTNIETLCQNSKENIFDCRLEEASS